MRDNHGVYLLVSQNTKFRNKTYVGYTTNPERRTIQHNLGCSSGGAYKTSKKGPWIMYLIVHGFPNNISGLRFEWAWQHPDKSRRLRTLHNRIRTDPDEFQFRIQVLSQMLHVGPWNRLALTIQWLEPRHRIKFEIILPPPNHMQIKEGPIVTYNIKNNFTPKTTVTTNNCHLCQHNLRNDVTLNCPNKYCNITTHLTCLAEHFIKSEANDHVLPLVGKCPNCCIVTLWADLINK